jgi:hypothetical protein
VLLHRLQQRGLRLRRRTVDLVRQHDVPEHGPVHELEEPPPGGVVLLEQLGAGDVARHQVGRELHARELEIERLRHGLHEQGLRETRHADEQCVTPRQNGRDEVVHDLALPHDSARDLLVQRGARRSELVQQLQVARIVARATYVGGRRHGLGSGSSRLGHPCKIGRGPGRQ